MVKIVSSLAQAECMFFSKKSLALVLCPRRFVCGICSRIVLIVWGEIGGGVCLPRSQLKQNL
jgi:hypothetical protein